MLLKIVTFLILIFAVLLAAGIILYAQKEACDICYLYLVLPVALVVLVVFLRMKFEK